MTKVVAMSIQPRLYHRAIFFLVMLVSMKQPFIIVSHVCVRYACVTANIGTHVHDNTVQLQYRRLGEFILTTKRCRAYPFVCNAQSASNTLYRKKLENKNIGSESTSVQFRTAALVIRNRTSRLDFIPSCHFRTQDDRSTPARRPG